MAITMMSNAMHTTPIVIWMSVSLLPTCDDAISPADVMSIMESSLVSLVVNGSAVVSVAVAVAAAVAAACEVEVVVIVLVVVVGVGDGLEIIVAGIVVVDVDGG